MTQEEITKMFENRWRIKSDNHPEACVKGVKELCRDFFEAGLLLGQGFVTGELIRADGTPTGIEVTVMHDPILDTANKGFSDWWDLYDKKIDRAKCFKKWMKLTDDERRACLISTPAYVASTPDLQFRRHPITYLNNKSWENQIIPHDNGNKHNDSAERLADILVG